MDTFSKPKAAVRDLVCPKCGVAAACDCGKAPIERAEYAVLQNPEKSSRSIAAAIGVGRKTVDRARAKATGPRGPVEKRVGLDSKIRRMPKQKVEDDGDDDDELDEDETEGSEEAFLMRAEQAIKFAVYTGPVSKELVAAARAAADAWRELVQTLEKAKRGKSKGCTLN
jgi:hypothetical protein